MLVLAPKGRNSKAQAAGLGKPAERAQALKGRNSTGHGARERTGSNSSRALSGLGLLPFLRPRPSGLGFAITPLQGWESVRPVFSRRYG